MFSYFVKWDLSYLTSVASSQNKSTISLSLKNTSNLKTEHLKKTCYFESPRKYTCIKTYFWTDNNPGKRGGGKYNSATPAIWCYIMERNLLIVRLKNLSTSGERDTCEVDGSTRSSTGRWWWSEKRNKMPRRNGEREKRKSEGEGRGVKQGRGHS